MPAACWTHQPVRLLIIRIFGWEQKQFHHAMSSSLLLPRLTWVQIFLSPAIFCPAPHARTHTKNNKKQIFTFLDKMRKTKILNLISNWSVPQSALRLPWWCFSSLVRRARWRVPRTVDLRVVLSGVQYPFASTFRVKKLPHYSCDCSLCMWDICFLVCQCIISLKFY